MGQDAAPLDLPLAGVKLGVFWKVGAAASHHHHGMRRGSSSHQRMGVVGAVWRAALLCVGGLQSPFFQSLDPPPLKYPSYPVYPAHSWFSSGPPPLQWFDDSDPEVLACCRAAVAEAQAQGAELVPVVLPELEMLRVAHSVTIVSEMHHCMQVGRQPPQELCCLWCLLY